MAIINIRIQKAQKIIKIKEDKKVYTNKDLDYTYIEIDEKDGIRRIF